MEDFKPIALNDEKEGIFFYTTQQTCDSCGKKLSKYGIYQECFSRSKYVDNSFKILCSDCRRKNKYQEKLFDVVFNRFVIVCSSFPKSSFPYLVTFPGFKNVKSLSVFDVADKQIDNEVTEDNTVLSNRLQHDYNPNLLEERDRKLLEKDELLDSPLNNDSDLNNTLKVLSEPSKNNLLEGSQ